MEQGPTFRCTVPKYPTRDPNYRILAPQRSRFTHYYFYYWLRVFQDRRICLQAAAGLDFQPLTPDRL
jgi:hypothetical protein